jgi:Putative Zn-dependent protease, contains TPR repeats
MIALLFALALTTISQEVPAVCDPQDGGETDWAACAAALPEGSSQQRFARLNQATAAYFDGDYGEATRVFDRLGPLDDLPLAEVHAFRADTYQQVGRDKAATASARTAWRIMSAAGPGAPESTPAADASYEEEQRYLLSLILPILKKGRDPLFDEAFAAFRALPVKDADGYGSLALVLEQLGDLDGALEASLSAVKAEPANPGYLNNHCYILVRSGRPAEGLPYCEKAVRGAPEVAAVRHSLAAALAGVGRCAEAETALAEARRMDPATILYQEPIACTGR